jgi:hypothetical protein
MLRVILERLDLQMRGNVKRHGARSIAMVVALLGPLTIAAAQDADAPDQTADDETVAQAPPPSDEELASALREALNNKLDDDVPVRTAPWFARQSPAAGLDWNSTSNSNGTTAYTVKRVLPVDWDTKVGADLGVNDMPSGRAEPVWPLPAARNSGAAWATVQVPGVASFDARLSAGAEPNKFGVSRTLPLSNAASLTLQNSYAVTEASAGVPVGLPGPASIWSNDRAVKFNIAATGTTFGASATNSTGDSVTHNRLSAEQRLFEKFNITTSLNDVGATASSKSITAGIKTNW